MTEIPNKITRADLNDMLAHGCIDKRQYHKLIKMPRIEDQNEFRPLTILDWTYIICLCAVFVAIGMYLGVHRNV